MNTVKFLRNENKDDFFAYFEKRISEKIRISGEYNAFIKKYKALTIDITGTIQMTINETNTFITQLEKAIDFVKSHI